MPKKKGLGLTTVSNVSLFDLSVDASFTHEERETLRSFHIPEASVTSYDRMICNNMMRHSRTYSWQGEKSFDRAVFLNDGSFGVIERILHFEETESVFVILRGIEIDQNAGIVIRETNKTLSNVKVCHFYPFGALAWINANRIVENCVVMKVPPRMYVAAYHNIYEGG